MPRQNLLEVVRRLIVLHVVEVVERSIDLRIVNRACSGSRNAAADQNQKEETAASSEHKMNHRSLLPYILGFPSLNESTPRGMDLPGTKSVSGGPEQSLQFPPHRPYNPLQVQPLIRVLAPFE